MRLNETQRMMIVIALENFLSDAKKIRYEMTNQASTNDELQMLEDMIQYFRKLDVKKIQSK